ncbi:MAG: undecaprenyldiphospho-muramoylpentapeptide beta-N-acetylglucosaminyltransferase [Clostridia bacterium]|nr:undecaprenyldiphospho-muramoylpentapeptide beta-N-acetylglucosaminyltransferase [Clostridia bacterium]
MRILFAGGGTGGHINPAISIANYIKQRDEKFEALFVGTESGLEKKLVPDAGYNIEYIDIKGFSRKKLYKNIEVLIKLFRANRRCMEIIKKFNPDVVVCTGGYVSGPVAMAAKKLGVGAVIHEQNVYPGLTVKAAQKYVDYIAVSFDETIRHMKRADKCVVTGNPIRQEILSADSKKSREALGIGFDKPFVLIFGGSLGADKINDAVLHMLDRVTKEQRFYLMFGTGDRNFEKFSEGMAAEKIMPTPEMKVLPYINNMHHAMAAADLVVSRSGAITVSEIASLGKPSILIPSPNVVRNHQEQNARELEKNGACVVIGENILTGDVLYNKIIELISDKEKLNLISAGVKKFAVADALERIYGLILKASRKTSHSSRI